MNINSGTVTIVIALAAIISPILVAVINNAHHTKMRKLEISAEQDNKRAQYVHSIYENYLKCAGRCIADPTAENLDLYGENYSIAFAYFPPAAHSMLKQLNASVRSREWDAANSQLESLSIWLSTLMKDMLKL